MIIIGIIVIVLLWFIYKKVTDIDEYNKREPLTKESAEEYFNTHNQDKGV